MFRNVPSVIEVNRKLSNKLILALKILPL
jgi:hypothetical protein